MAHSPRLERAAADSADAVGLLDAYFDERAASRPADAGPYLRTDPDAARFAPPEGAFLLARDPETGEALGCGGIRREPVADGHELRGAAWFEVKHLFVIPAARGRGISRLLLAALEDEARELGADRIVLDTHSSQAAAGGLYAASGYELIAPYNGNGNADRWYAKRI